MDGECEYNLSMIFGDGEWVVGGGGRDGVLLFFKGNGLGRFEINFLNKFWLVVFLVKVLKVDFFDGIRCFGGGWFNGEGVCFLCWVVVCFGFFLWFGGKGVCLLGWVVG